MDDIFLSIHKMHLLQTASRKYKEYEIKHYNYSYGRDNRGETSRLGKLLLASARAWMGDIGGLLVYDFEVSSIPNRAHNFKEMETK